MSCTAKLVAEVAACDQFKKAFSTSMCTLRTIASRKVTCSIEITDNLNCEVLVSLEKDWVIKPCAFKEYKSLVYRGASMDFDFLIPTIIIQHEKSGLENLLALPCRPCPPTKLLARLPLFMFVCGLTPCIEVAAPQMFLCESLSKITVSRYANVEQLEAAIPDHFPLRRKWAWNCELWAWCNEYKAVGPLS